MGCGESKHATATTEPVKKSASRSSSRRIETPDTTNDDGFSKTVDGGGEKTVGVIPGEPFVYQKPPMETAKNGGKEERKKLVVVVGHDRTASKESQVSDYFSEDGIEEKSEYESPHPDEERGSKMTEDKMKQEQVITKEGFSERQEDQILAAKQDENKATQVEQYGTDRGEQDRSNDTTMIMEIDEIKPTELVVRTIIAEEKIKNADS